MKLQLVCDPHAEPAPLKSHHSASGGDAAVIAGDSPESARRALLGRTRADRPSVPAAAAGPSRSDYGAGALRNSCPPHGHDAEKTVFNASLVVEPGT